MRKLAILLAVGAAALMGSSAANAADQSGNKVKATSDQSQITDFSSQRRWRAQRHYRHVYRPYRSYGYYPQPYYGGYGYAPQRYYGGGPVVSFSLGGGGYRGGGWGHRW